MVALLGFLVSRLEGRRTIGPFLGLTFLGATDSVGSSFLLGMMSRHVAATEPPLLSRGHRKTALGCDNDTVVKRKEGVGSYSGTEGTKRNGQDTTSPLGRLSFARAEKAGATEDPDGTGHWFASDITPAF